MPGDETIGGVDEAARQKLKSIFEALSQPSRWPASASPSYQNEWIEFGEVEARVVGWVSTTTNYGRVDPTAVRSTRERLQAEQEWATQWPKEHAALLRACSLLLDV